MATTTSKPPIAVALLDDLRQLINRFGGADTDDQARELADELTALLRRARARLAAAARRAKRAAEPANPAASKVEQEQAVTTTSKPSADPPKTTTQQRPTPAVAEKPAKPATPARSEAPAVRSRKGGRSPVRRRRRGQRWLRAVAALLVTLLVLTVAGLGVELIISDGAR